MGTNIMANQVKTPIQNYFEKVLYENLTFEIPPLWFSYAGGRTGVLTGFRTLTLVLYIGSLRTRLGHMIPLWKGKNLIYFGVIRSKVKVTVTINIIFDNRVVST